MEVPFSFLNRAERKERPLLDRAYQRVVSSNWFILGQEVAAFEQEFATFCGAQYGVGVANGLEAIQLLLIAEGIGAGDEVIVAANTYIATWMGVSLAGARPVPVEPDAAGFNIDPQRIAAAITPRTKAIFGTHLYGEAGDCRQIEKMARQHGLAVFWDAAQAHGAKFEGQPISQFAGATAFSFYPTKNLGCLGDGGAVVTNNLNLANKLRQLRNYGSLKRYENEVMGFNSRLDELQAAFLREKLCLLAQHNAWRQQIAATYHERLHSVPNLTLPAWSAGHVWHLYVVRHPERDALRQALLQLGIETDVHYPKAPHLQPAYRHLGFAAGDFPISEKMHAEVISLPMHPYLAEKEAIFVCDAIREFCKSTRN